MSQPERAALLAETAVRALLAELELFPKPGLVSPVDTGSHRDMDYALLATSAETLRPFFLELAKAADAPFQALALIGLRAEKQMLQVTGGINTHRGAIFALGLLVAATAASESAGNPGRIRETLQAHWGKELSAHAQAESASHGSQAQKLTGAGGARKEAALGFPSVFELALPHFRELLGVGVSQESAALETLFLLAANLEDTNLIHRGGIAGSQFARQRARNFLESGGVSNPDWEKLARQIHREFIERNLSPGGAADLLAATLFIHEVT